MDDTPTLVQLGAKTIELRAPQDYVTCLEIETSRPRNIVRAMGAALGACWTGHPLKSSLAACSHDVMVYGGAVWRELLERNAPPADLAKAGRQALELVHAALISDEEVADAEATFRPEAE